MVYNARMAWSPALITLIIEPPDENVRHKLPTTYIGKPETVEDGIGIGGEMGPGPPTLP